MTGSTRLLYIAFLAAAISSSGNSQSHAVQSQTNQKAPEQQRTDLSGDPLPSGAVMRFGTMRWQAIGKTLAFSPDSRTILIFEPGLPSSFPGFGRRDEVHALDVQTGRLLSNVDFQRPPALQKLAIEELAAGVMSGRFQILSAFSKDCKTVATFEQQPSKIRFWDVGTGKLLREFSVDLGQARLFSCSPDGSTLIATGADHSFHIWDSATGKERDFPGTEHGLRSPPFGEFSANSQVLVAFVGDQFIRTWNVRSARLLSEIKVEARALSVSPDGTTVASVRPNSQEIQLWSSHTGKGLRSVRIGPEEPVEDFEFSPDGSLLVIKGNEKVLLWNLAADKLQQTIPAASPDWFGISPDNRLLACSNFKSVRIWDVATGRELSARVGHREAVDYVCVSADGKMIASVSRGGSTVNMWNTREGGILGSIGLIGNPAGSPFFSADSKLLVATESPNTVRIWSISNSKEVSHFSARDWQLPGSQNAICQISTDMKSVAGAAKYTTQSPVSIYVWDATSGKVVKERQLSDCHTFCFSPDNSLVAHDVMEKEENDSEPNAIFGSRRRKPPRWSLVVEELASGNELFRVPTGFIVHLQFSRDGRTLAGLRHTTDGRDAPEFCVWEVATGKERTRFHTTGLYAFAWSPNARLCATIDLWSFRVWDVATSREVFRHSKPFSLACAFAFSPDNRLLFTGMDNSTILAWELPAKVGRPNLNSKALDQNELSSLWKDLASADAAKAHRAIWTLIEAPEQAVPFLKTQLRPTGAADVERISRLIADIDKSNSAARETAVKELQVHYFGAEKLLRAELQKNLPLETRRRIEQVLAHRSTGPSPDQLAQLRAVETLEYIGNTEAIKVLELMAAGAPGGPLTEEAKGSLERLSAKPK